jgi:hypothetical protein
MTNPIGPKPRIPDDVGVTVGTTASPTGSKRRSAVLHILSPHTVRRTVALLALATVAAMATGVVAPGVAQAATCKTRAHAYVTQPGRIYLAGYEGDTSLGIPTWRTFPGDTFQIGGNGIQPGTTIHFIAVDAVGNQVDFGLSDSLPAGENCAANEGPTYRVVAPKAHTGSLPSTRAGTPAPPMSSRSSTRSSRTSRVPWTLGGRPR